MRCRSLSCLFPLALGLESGGEGGGEGGGRKEGGKEGGREGQRCERERVKDGVGK